MHEEVETARLPAIPDGDNIPLVLCIVPGEFMFARQRVDGIVNGQDPVPVLIGLRQNEAEPAASA